MAMSDQAHSLFDFGPMGEIYGDQYGTAVVAEVRP